jgi:hypothetical protein
MSLINNPIIIIIIIAVAIVLLINRFCKKKEAFAPMEATLFSTPNYKTLSPSIWESQWYQAHHDPATNIPLKQLYKEQKRLPTKMGSYRIHMKEQMQSRQEVPMPQNVPTGQVEQVADVPGNDNISQVGAPLEEVIRQEVALAQPLQFMSPELQEIMRQEQLKLNELSAQYQQPQNMVEIQQEFQHVPGMTPEVRQAEMEQKMRNMNQIEAQKVLNISNQINMEVAPETQFIHSEIVPEYNSESDAESLIQDLANSEEIQEHRIEEAQDLLEQELMPGMEQKARLEQELSEQLGEQITVEVQPDNNKIPLAILLSVLLVGFVYQTKEY